MCSFLFFLSKRSKDLVQKLQHANRYMQHRGPDGTHVIRIGDCIFLHNLLHICGARITQPLVKEDIVVLFNGEIYNYKQLCAGLEMDKEVTSDTECIIPLYKKYGPDFVRMLDGEFAITLYDHTKQHLLYTTDVFMTKPLYIGRSSVDGGNSGNGGIGLATYASALESLEFDTIQMAVPNETIVIDLRTNEVLHKKSVFDFDLRQFKTDTQDWERAFETAVYKRATHGAQNAKIFLCLSSGYDSGCIALALNRKAASYDTYSTLKNENEAVLRSRLATNRQSGACQQCYVACEVHSEVHNEQGAAIRGRCEPFVYVHDDGGGDGGGSRTEMSADGGARALNYIAKEQSQRGYRVMLSGSGADEIFSDYGFRGQKIYAHSEFGGMWPPDLKSIFPWRKFYGDTQRSYLFKDEFVAGGYGIEGRYPFLDKQVVQEWLWLTPEVKNAEYKCPLVRYMKRHAYPVDEGRKLGFNI
jgi:asparagine synthetase B (glutamine-hydrolysing)